MLFVRSCRLCSTEVMDEPASRTGPIRRCGDNENRLKLAVDAGFLSGTREEEFSDSDSCDSTSESSSSSSTRLPDLSASFRVFSESLLRRELAEMEMMKSREALRCEAEKQRLESEAELTQMMMQTQLQIASLVAGTGMSQKRKRGDEEELTPLSQRQRTLLMSLLQCNFIV